MAISKLPLLNHALSLSLRCYSFGIGPTVCYRLVKGLASVSKGSAEFLMEGERLQPKVHRKASSVSQYCSSSSSDRSEGEVEMSAQI